MRVWAAQFNPMIHESAYRTLAIYRTRKLARRAVRNHRREEVQKFGPSDWWEKWRVISFEVIAD